MDVEIAVDISGIQAMADVVYSVTEAIADKRTMNRVVHAAAREGRVQFQNLMDISAREAPSAYGHVYEWDKVGSPSGRLFRVILTRPAEGRLNARTEFLPSKQPVRERPLVGQTIDVTVINGDGTDRTIEMEVWPNQNQHVFRDKASVMENGTTVHIKPKNAKMLFWVDPEEEHGYMARQATIDNSTRPTVNKFSEMWNNFWENMVEPMVIRPMTKDLEPAIQQSVDKAMAKETSKTAPVPARPPTPGQGMQVVFYNNGKRQVGPMHAKRRISVERTVQNDITRRLNKYG